jgi:hypothetical protein
VRAAGHPLRSSDDPPRAGPGRLSPVRPWYRDDADPAPPDPAAVPGAVPGSGPHGTVLCALHGTLAVHPWIDPAEDGEDAYGLFVARSEALGWWDRPGTGLWGMNDAAGVWRPPDGEHDEAAANAAVGGDRIAWFQVGLPDAAEGRALPLQAVVACAADVVERVGRVELAAVQVLVSLYATTAAPRTPSGTTWFGVADPAARTALRVTVDAGDDPVPLADVLGFLRERHTEPFRFTGGAPGAGVAPRPVVAGEHWIRPGRHPVTLDVEAPEWSAAAAGWLCAAAAEACRHAGLRGDVLLSCGR